MSNELVEDTIGEPTASEDEENGDLTDFDLYTEKATSLIYEAKVFDDSQGEAFVIVRPASPYFYDAIARMSVETFAEDFEEFAGDHSKVKKYVKNITDSLDEMI